MCQKTTCFARGTTHLALEYLLEKPYQLHN